MAWGSDTAATQLTSITTEQFFDQVPTLNPRETAHVQVSIELKDIAQSGSGRKRGTDGEAT